MFGRKKKKNKKKGKYSLRASVILGLTNSYEEFMEWSVDPSKGDFSHVETGSLPVEVGLGISLMMPFGESEPTAADAPPKVVAAQSTPEDQEMFAMISTMLEQQWGITSSDELLETVSILLSNPVDHEYVAMRPYIQQLAGRPVKERDDAAPQIIEMAVADFQQTEIPEEVVREDLGNWLDLYTQEHSEKLIPQKLPSTLAGWEIGRAARVARMGYMLGMIDLDQYLNISSTALALTREFSESWRDHVDQFLLGRAKWQEILDEDTLDHRDMMRVRLQHPNSMWFKYPLHGSYETERNS